MRWIKFCGAVLAAMSMANLANAGFCGLSGGCGAAKSCGCASTCQPACCKPVIVRPCCPTVHTYQRRCSDIKPPCCDSCCPTGCCTSSSAGGACCNTGNGCAPACAAPAAACAPACAPACAAPAATCAPACAPAATCAAPAATCAPACAPACAAPAVACAPACAPACAAPASCAPACAAPAASCAPASTCCTKSCGGGLLSGLFAKHNCASSCAPTCGAPAACATTCTPVCETKCCNANPCDIAKLIYTSQTACYARQRRAALRKLGNRYDCICNPEIMTAFVYGLNDADERVRRTAADKIGDQIRKNCCCCPEVVAALTCALGDCDRGVRRQSEQALRLCGYEIVDGCCNTCCSTSCGTSGCAPAGGSAPMMMPAGEPASPAPVPPQERTGSFRKGHLSNLLGMRI